MDKTINNITLDHNRGGALVAELFIQLQYKNVALIGGPVDHFDTIERGRGFVSRLAEESIVVPEQARCYGDFTDYGSRFRASEYRSRRDRRYAACRW